MKPILLATDGSPSADAATREAIDLALKQKAPLATHIITQICFDAGTTAAWAAGIAAAGIDIPVRVGMPGPVNRQKLVRISARLGLGQSARFLRNQHHLLWRFVLPGGYRPTRLARRLGGTVPTVASNIRGFSQRRARRCFESDQHLCAAGVLHQ